MNCIIAGCVKNCEKYIDLVFNNISEIKSLFNKNGAIQIIIAYDNSTDDTLFKLEKYKKIYNIDILINNEPLSNIRTINIANARNKLEINYWIIFI